MTMRVLTKGFGMTNKRSDEPILDGDTRATEGERSPDASAAKRVTVAPKKNMPLKSKRKNYVQSIRESLLMSKAELARKAGLSVLTVGRIEQGIDCRMDTKRKIILALGLTLADKEKVFAEEMTNKNIA